MQHWQRIWIINSAAVAVARDEAGNFLGASLLVLDGLTNPEVVEMVACWEGMAPTLDLVLQKHVVGLLLFKL